MTTATANFRTKVKTLKTNKKNKTHKSASEERQEHKTSPSVDRVILAGGRRSERGLLRTDSGAAVVLDLTRGGGGAVSASCSRPGGLGEGGEEEPVCRDPQGGIERAVGWRWWRGMGGRGGVG